MRGPLFSERARSSDSIPGRGIALVLRRARSVCELGVVRPRTLSVYTYV